MAEKTKLFHKIILENLMLHEHTEINLSNEAISLITGANGSGKTQILDGLIICLGYIPARAKAKGVGSLVGKDSNHAYVTLEIQNPVANERRTIQTLDQDLNNIINKDIFTINAKVSKEESKITYSINDSRRIVRGRLVTRRDIRRIFESIGVRGDNKLAFTGEGTVDEFASKSAKRKLDVLLEVTGLKQYREEVIASQETLKSSIQEIEPLKRKYETESKLLNLWSNALKIINQKKKLMLQKKSLEIELTWSIVLRFEKRLERVNQERLKLLKQKSENSKEIEEKEQEIESIKRRLEVLNNELDLIEETERVKNRELIKYETQMSSEDENITNFLKETERYQEQKSELERILSKKDLSDKDRKLQDKQEILAVKQQKLSMIQEKYSNADIKLKNLRKKIVTEQFYDSFTSDNEVYSGTKLTQYEESLINAAKIFALKLKQQNLNQEIIGPIISHISMKDGEKSWEQAVKNIIGRNLYAFVAKTDESYRYAKRLYDETWPRWKPPLSVYKVSTRDAQKADIVLQKPKFKEVYDIATNLIEGDPFIVGLLKRISKGALADDKYGPNVLTNIARDSRINILTKSSKSYYLSYGGFGRPPAPMKTTLGWKIKQSKDKSIKDNIDERKIRISIAKLEKETRDLKIDEIKTLQEISRLHLEIQALGMPDEKLLGKIETINEIISVIDAKIKECKIHRSQLNLQIDDASEEFGSYSSQRSIIKRKIEDVQESLEYLKIDKRVLQEKSTRLLTLEINYDAEYSDILDEKNEKEQIAINKGERPEEIRDYSEIRDELSRIEGNLESIGISDVDEEKIEAQKMKVDSLKTYMKEREEHITNLRADLDARLTFWSGELQDVITNITKSMKLLLSGIFERIKLKVTNINKPEEAGLFIEAITKGKAYRDFQELSGGEKVLAIEGLILAMHTLTDSPIHAIDEFTQRLDEKNKALAFSIAIRTQKLASETSRFVPQFILLCPDALNVDVSKDVNHMVVSEMKVIKAEAIK